MPVTPTYPGVYIEEVPSGVHTIVGVATAITAFVGRAQRGPVNVPITIQNFADYERGFGGLWQPSTMSYAVQQYFQNGGGEALAIRIERNATLSTASLSAGADTLDLESADPGAWGGNLQVTVDHDTEPVDPDRFNLTVEEVRPATPPADPQISRYGDPSQPVDGPRTSALRRERAARLEPDPGRWHRPDGPSRRAGSRDLPRGQRRRRRTPPRYLGSQRQKTGCSRSRRPTCSTSSASRRRAGRDIATVVWEPPPLLQARRAVLHRRPAGGWDRGRDATTDYLGLTRDENAALYFPRLRFADPLQSIVSRTSCPAAAVAGAMARTDAARGVWKAPAGPRRRDRSACADRAHD